MGATAPMTLVWELKPDMSRSAIKCKPEPYFRMAAKVP